MRYRNMVIPELWKSVLFALFMGGMFTVGAILMFALIVWVIVVLDDLRWLK